VTDHGELVFMAGGCCYLDSDSSLIFISRFFHAVNGFSVTYNLSFFNSCQLGYIKVNETIQMEIYGKIEEPNHRNDFSLRTIVSIIFI